MLFSASPRESKQGAGPANAWFSSDPGGLMGKGAHDEGTMQSVARSAENPRRRPPGDALAVRKQAGGRSPDLGCPRGPRPSGPREGLQTAETTRQPAALSGRGLCWFSKDKASDELRPRKTKAQGGVISGQSSEVSPASRSAGGGGAAAAASHAGGPGAPAAHASKMIRHHPSGDVDRGAVSIRALCFSSE